MNDTNDERMPVVSPENCGLYRKSHNAIDTEYWIILDILQCAPYYYVVVFIQVDSGSSGVLCFLLVY